MCRMLRKPVLASAMALAMGACGVTPDQAASPVAPTVSIPAEHGAVSAAGNPVGTFRTTPVAQQEGIVVRLGDPVQVNGARFVAADPGDELKLEVEWGDGDSGVVGCGACRLSHVYGRPGTYALTATIHNRRTVDRGQVTRVFSVSVENPQAPEPVPAPAPAPQFCHSINAITTFGTQGPIACPSGATQFCDSVPIVATSSTQARLACETCAGTICDFGHNPATVIVGDEWHFLQAGGTVRGYFQFTDDPAPGTKTAGSISIGSGNAATPAKGRWAP
jgi:hypothetical protein